MFSDRIKLTKPASVKIKTKSISFSFMPHGHKGEFSNASSDTGNKRITFQMIQMITSTSRQRIVIPKDFILVQKYMTGLPCLYLMGFSNLYIYFPKDV